MDSVKVVIGMLAQDCRLPADSKCLKRTPMNTGNYGIVSRISDNPAPGRVVLLMSGVSRLRLNPGPGHWVRPGRDY